MAVTQRSAGVSLVHVAGSLWGPSCSNKEMRTQAIRAAWPPLDASLEVLAKAAETGGGQASWTGELSSCHKVDWEKLNPRTSLWWGQWEEERLLGAGLGSEQTVAVIASVPS